MRHVLADLSLLDKGIRVSGPGKYGKRHGSRNEKCDFRTTENTI